MIDGDIIAEKTDLGLPDLEAMIKSRVDTGK